MGKIIEKETSWERYKRTLYPNDIRIMFYLKYYEIDNLFDKSTTFYKPKFKNKEQEEIVYDLMKRVSFKRGILITLHLPSYLTYGRFSKRTWVCTPLKIQKTIIFKSNKSLLSFTEG